jgi:branched-chain amino acid transport system ATP-binding protein
MSALLEVERVTVAYGGVRAVAELSMTVPEGGVVALLGANGAGKTTTLRAISGLVRPASGRIWFDGWRVDGRPPHSIARRGLLHVPEGRGVFPSLTVRENLEMASYRIASIGDPVAEGARLFPVLGNRADQLAGSLSGGEQQMLAMARVLMTRPRLVLLDEISMGLAPIIVAQLYEAVRKMPAAGVTVLLVEQYISTALAIADYVYLLDKGRLADLAEPADFRSGGLLSAYLGGASR